MKLKKCYLVIELETKTYKCWYFDAKTAIAYGNMVCCYVVLVLLGFAEKFSL